MMRNSINLSSSSINNQSDTAFSGDEDYVHEDQEESGWTSYFDDFFYNKTPHISSSKHVDDMICDDQEEGTYNSCGGSGSVVSDAASCAAWNNKQSQLIKNCDDDDDQRSSRRADGVAASCSSFDGKQMVVHKKLRFMRNIINRHKKSSDNYYDDSLEDTASSPVNSPKAKGEVYGYDHQQQGKEVIGLNQRVVEVNNSLKEKGLCLVPYSMLMNYIG